MSPTNKQKSFQASSNLTLIVKLALPIFWATFFAAFTVSAFNTPMHNSFHVSPSTFRIGVVVFYITGLLFLFFTLWQLKRVEFFEDHFFVTNYFKHVNYNYGAIESVSSINFIIVKLIIIKLAQKGHFGRRIPFLASRKRLRFFKEAYPELGEQIGI